MVHTHLFVNIPYLSHQPPVQLISQLVIQDEQATEPNQAPSLPSLVSLSYTSLQEVEDGSKVEGKLLHQLWVLGDGHGAFRIKDLLHTVLERGMGKSVNSLLKFVTFDPCTIYIRIVK